MKCLILILVVLATFVYGGLYVYFSCQEDNWTKYIHQYLPLTLVAIWIAYAAYVRAVDFLDTSSLPQLSDRCLASRLKDDEVIVEGKKVRMTYPSSINEGGDAYAYEELIKIYIRSKGNFKEDVRRYLAKISHNLASARTYFQGVGVHRSSNRSWQYSKTGVNEEFDEYDVSNVIDQLNEPNYWVTRATCAIFLRNDKYLKSIKDFPEQNRNRLKDYNWAKLFDNLVSNVSSDSSLMVRKISLDTYQFWACNNEVGVGCHEFIKNDVYYFDRVVEHWKQNRETIVQKFKKSIGL